MLVESDYDSWKIRIHRYIRGKPNGKLIWKSIQNGPTPHPMITDPPPTDSTVVPAPRKKLDSEFNEEENKLEMADTQAEIILSQGLPRHIFNNLNQTSTAKEIWDNVEMLMQGSGRTIQQRKEDLFDEYERFRAIGNESIHDYFVRFHKLVNDMKITQLNIPTHQMNTKFVNNLPAYWGKYVTNVKQNMDISTTPYVQIYTHLKAYEPHAKKTLKKQEQSTSIVDPLAYVAHTTSAPALSSPSTPSPQPTAQSPNDALMATMILWNAEERDVVPPGYSFECSCLVFGLRCKPATATPGTPFDHKSRDLQVNCYGQSSNSYNAVFPQFEASPVCLLTKASSTKSWLWHRRLNHLNFGTLNELTRKISVRGFHDEIWQRHFCVHLAARTALRKDGTGLLMEAGLVTMLIFAKAPCSWAERCVRDIEGLTMFYQFRPRHHKYDFCATVQNSAIMLYSQDAAVLHLFVNEPEPPVSLLKRNSAPVVTGKPLALIIYLYQNLLDEYGDVLKNKARLVAKGYRRKCEFMNMVYSDGRGKPRLPQRRLFEVVFVSNQMDFFVDPEHPSHSGFKRPPCRSYSLAREKQDQTSFTDADYEDGHDTQRSNSGSAQFLDIGLLAGIQKAETSKGRTVVILLLNDGHGLRLQIQERLQYHSCLCDLKDMLEERGCCTTGLYSYEGYHGPGLSGLSPLVKWDLHKCCSIHTVIIDPHGIRANDDSKYPMQDHALILLKYLKEIEIKKIEEDTSSKLFQIPTDMSMWRLKISPLFPRIPGHEGVGVIESVGKDVKGLKPGDIVMPLYLGECGQCLNCKTGKTNLCHVYLPPFSGLMNDGTSRMTIARTGESIYHFTSCSTWTKYAVADYNYVLKIDPKISYPHASFLPCGFTTGFGATWRETQLSKGSLVSVFGIGTVGLGGIGTVVPIGAGGEASVAINSLILFSSRTLKCTTFGGIRTQSDLPVIINKCLNK
ncbi:retrovirus-related pol polyprotein from transposon TNT 1-94 [Tanacetum coccineum]